MSARPKFNDLPDSLTSSGGQAFTTIQIPWMGCIWLLPLLAALALPLKAETSELGADNQSLVREVGFQGNWKLGHWCRLRVQLPDSLRQDAAEVQITTLDGDGVEVVYRRQLLEGSASESDLLGSESDSRWLEIPIRIGRSRSFVTVSVLDGDGVELARDDHSLPEEQGLPSTQPLVLALGSAMGFEELVRTSADGVTQSLTLVDIASMEQLPKSWLEYQAVDLVIISLAASGPNSPQYEDRWRALDDWVRRGGTVVLSLSGSGTDNDQLSFIADWLPGKWEGESMIRNPAALESMIISDQPIQPFPAAFIEAESGRTRLVLTDLLGRRTAWWVTKAHGFGTVEVIASDLAHESFAQWKQRRLLWERVAGPYFDKSVLEGVRSAPAARTESYLGYQDLTGQLRATLDLFPGVTIVSFSQIAAILIAILVMIGPLDYLISVRWLKRPHLSWPIAGAVLLVSVFGLSWYYHSIRPDQLLINTASVIDVDPENSRVDGHLWSHVYSAHARRVNVSAQPSDGNVSVHLDWQGLPGTGLGGLQSQIRIERGMPSYTVDLADQVGSAIREVGIPAAGTKCFVGAWSEASSELVNSDSRSSLKEMSSVDQLEGEVMNPLTVDLRDTVLFYHRWFYPLRGRMPPGDRIFLSAEIIPRDISRRLNRQQEIDGKLETVRWNPVERGELDRLLELMMFHRAATGQNYTSLTHRYQPIIDHSNLLDSDYAILVGRLDAAPIELKVTPDSPTEQTAVSQAVNRTWVRILIPVAVQDRARGR
jgi:hypothetical protein